MWRNICRNLKRSRKGILYKNWVIISEYIEFVSWGFNPSEVSWIGCSVGASVKAVESMCLKRVDYEKDGFTEKIMEAYFLSSWGDRCMYDKWWMTMENMIENKK